MSRIRLLIEWLSIFACSCLIVWWASVQGITNRIDTQLLDWAASQRAAPANPDIVLVAIDDRSLAQWGQWPWDRRVMARLVDQLSAAKARDIVLDILYTEAASPAADDALAAAIARSGLVSLPIGFQLAENQAAGLAPLPPLPIFATVAKNVGQAAILPDQDGVNRRLPIILHEGGIAYPHLQHRLLQSGGEKPRFIDEGAEPPFLTLRPAGSYPTIPAAQVLAGEVPAQFLSGKRVIVGAFAAGLRDIHAVSSYAGTMMAGAELQANLLQTLQENSFIRPIKQTTALALSLAAIVVLFFGFWRFSPLHALLLATALVFGLILGTLWMAIYQGIWFAPGPALLALLLAYPLWGWRRLAAVSDYLGQQARQLTPALYHPDAAKRGGFDAVAKQVSQLNFLVDEVNNRKTFLANVIEASPDAICVFGADGRLILMNGPSRGIFGPDQDAVTFQDLVAGARGTIDADGQEVSLENGRIFTLATSQPEQTREWGDVRVVTLADVTELRRAENERRQMLEFLSHDMRSPQVAILGLSEERLTGGASPEDRFSRIQNHARRTLKLADDFVQLARLAEVPLEIEETDFCILAEEAMDRGWQAAKDKQIILLRDIPEYPIFGMADGHVLSRVLDNLIGNAIKYSPEESTITLSLEQEGDWAVVRITDQGPGLPPDRQADPFMRFGGRAKGKGISAGLGLSFVREALSKHGGMISCETAPESGTCFTLKLSVTAP